jgi:3',5'-cyclic AMP phosphodiesterase CpdA
MESKNHIYQTLEHPAEALKKRDPIFTFAILSDSHINPIESESSSPWKSNRLANARTRKVIHELNKLSPKFVIHLGDLVHPVPALPAYKIAIEKFRKLFRNLNSSLYIVPGNHDVGDKIGSWMPAENVTEKYIDLFKRQFGDSFYSFDFDDCHFVVINSQIMNSGMNCEEVQKTWLIKDLADNIGKRIFLFTHYPLYITEPNESGHYDNIDEPARFWLLELLKKYKIEAVFAGHVHNFFYNRYADTECYVVPSVTFVRHDYSELFRVGPAAEYGRNDHGKFGYFHVKVYKTGHVAHFIRTYGTILENSNSTPNITHFQPTFHSKESPWASIGVDMRYPWAEMTEMPYNGVLDEFYRKKARNDYTLLALWEMGIRNLRVPYTDLLDSATRERMYALRTIGHRFTVFHYDMPQDRLREILLKHNELVSSLELIVPWDDILTRIPELKDLKNNVAIPIVLSKLWSSADEKHDGSPFKHYINHGFNVNEKDMLEKFLDLPNAREVIDGFVFRVGRNHAPYKAIKVANQFVTALGVKAEIHIKMAAENPALSENEDKANANRVAETISAALVFDNINVFIDTFSDFDRGYFPRTGLVDRLYNPRAAGCVFRHLQSALGPSSKELSLEKAVQIPGGQLCHLKTPNEFLVLVLPADNLIIERISTSTEICAASGIGRAIDLVTGQIMPLDWQPLRGKHHAQIELDSALPCAVPMMLVFS